MIKLIYRFINIWRPSIFQGTYQNSKYFEGWFFKLIDPQRKTILAIIPGIFYGTNINISKAFVQIFWGNKNKMYFFEYPIKLFKASHNKFYFNIGDNFFSDREIYLKLDSKEISISGKLQFVNLKKWPNKLYSPGAMGPYSFAPFMQCNHDVISMNHSIKGKLKIDEKIYDFEHGRGYIEKDWGKSFPDAYVWVQCNHFSDSEVSLFASIAKIPWINGSFRGFIIGFLYKNKIYRFATYTGAKIEYLKIEDSYAEFEVKDNQHILHVKANRTKGVILHAPYNEKFLQRASESLISKVEVKFWQINNTEKKLIFHDSGNPAALDVNGKLNEIMG
jgi:hypothetical protein